MGAMAVIGGTGLNQLRGLSALAEEVVETPFGPASAPLMRLAIEGETGSLGTEFYFLARHGRPHRIPPHRINYRANLWALREAGVSRVLAINAVGGIGERMTAGVIAIPQQLVDYTWGREHTYYDGRGGALSVAKSDGLEHVDFTLPYSLALRQQLLEAARRVGVPVIDGGVYAATQGPRLETAAEIRRLDNDGCDLVGMTGMPEAALARELGLEYASLCLVVNPAASEAAGEITMADIARVLAAGMEDIHRLLIAAITG